MRIKDDLNIDTSIMRTNQTAQMYFDVNTNYLSDVNTQKPKDPSIKNVISNLTVHETNWPPIANEYSNTSQSIATNVNISNNNNANNNDNDHNNNNNDNNNDNNNNYCYYY